MGKTVKTYSFDAKKERRARQKNKFKTSTTAERQFYKQLKKVARASGHIVERHADGAHLKGEAEMMRALEGYSRQITPWATRQASKMLETVAKSNKRAYRNQGLKMNQHLVALTEENVGKTAIALLNEQVELIKSIPLEAGLRAQRIAQENFLNGTRAAADPETVARLQEEMGMSTEVAVNRAKLIARTETARANASFVQARAAAIGAKGYIWRTTMDGAERESHAEMNGKFVEYSRPPKLSDGTRGHAGTFPNCRCYQDPVLPED